MKTAAVILAALALFGCQHRLPPNTLLIGAKSTINTPWGPATLEAAKAATGEAAKVLAEAEGKK